MHKKSIYLIGVCIIIVLAALYFNQKPNQSTSKSTQETAQNVCILSNTKACQVDKVQASLEPKELKALKPIKLSVDWQSENSKNLTVYFEGRDMDMGKLKFPLTRSTQTGQFEGQLTFPKCMHDSMVWVGYIQDPQTQKKVPVEIEVAS